MVRLDAVALLAMLTGTACAVPTEIAEVYSETAALEKRSGSAYIWSGDSCDGTQIAGFTNVGCGGQCHVITGPGSIRYANSVNLYWSGFFGPITTMNVYSDDNCQDFIEELGDGSNGDCLGSNQPFQSFYIYYNC